MVSEGSEGMLATWEVSMTKPFKAYVLFMNVLLWLYAWYQEACVI